MATFFTSFGADSIKLFASAKPNPFAVIVAAHLTTQQTNQDPSRRYQGKLRIAKSLYQRGYSRQDIKRVIPVD